MALEIKTLDTIIGDYVGEEDYEPLHIRKTGGPSLAPNPPRSALATILSSPFIPAGTRHEYEQVFPQP